MSPSVPVAAVTKTSWFAPKLQSAMERRSLSVRALARAWRPNADVETSRRSLNRYLNDGVVPGSGIRAELADTLKVDRSELEQEDEDEADLVVQLVNRLIERKLEQRMRELLRDQDREVAS